MRHQLLQHVAGAALLVMLGSFAAPAAAQGIKGEAVGAYVRLATGSSTNAARAVLTDGSPMAENSVDRLDVPGTITTSLLTAVTAGESTATRSGAQSVATAADVSILDGLIQADRVIAVASSIGGPVVGSDANGSGFENLVVNGMPVVSDGLVPANTRIALPGVGHVVLNERSSTGSGGITVNMIHVVLQDALTGRTVGEIVVGSASSLAR